MKALKKAEQISDLIMNERCEAPVQDLFSKGLHQLLVELLDELDERENRSCKTCTNSGFCGVYNFIKSVKNEDKRVSSFSCSEYKQWISNE